MAGTVKAIDRRSVHQICSGQVVLNLATAIKELVENSLDAGGTNIEIKLKEYGSDSIEVSDNGSGVGESNFAGLTLKHHTSKLSDFSDLSTVDTFGFRGEALSSLCALSDLSVVTCHQSAAVGTKLSYDHDGRILKQAPCPRQQGTTVTLQNLFSTLPVRHREFLRNLKKEFGKMVQVLQAYCIIASGVKLSCTNQPDKGKKSLIVSTNGTATMRENIANVFGSKQLQSLLEFNQCKPSTELCEEYGLKQHQLDKIPFSMSGFVSKCDHGLGRSAADRQYFFINRRPCDFPKVSKLFNEVYHMYNRHQYPFIVLDISLAKDAVDVNVTPDKRKVLIQEEKTLLAILKASLQAMFEPRSSSFDLNQKPMTSVTPSSAALSAMFGRGPGSGGLTPAGKVQLDPGVVRQGTKLNLANLKRSFAHAHQADEEQLEKKPKQPKLDAFLIKSPDASRTGCSEGSKSNDGSHSSETRDEERTCVSTNQEPPSVDGNDMLHRTPDVCQTSETATCTITFDNGSTDSRNDVDVSVAACDTSPTPAGDVGSIGHHQHPSSELTLSPEVLVVSHEHPRGEHIAPSSRSTKDASQDESVGRSDGESGFCGSSPVGGSGGMESRFGGSGGMESSEQSSSQSSLEAGGQGVVGRTPTGRDDVNGDGESERRNKTVIHRLDEGAPASSVERREVTIPVSMAGLRRAQEMRESGEEGRAVTGRAFRAKIAPSDNASAEEELKKEISKDMFGEMEILGQFNLGFIITRLGRDLFIIDQHATDEKYNFETLQKHNVLQGQRLIQPMLLELTAVSESILMDNLEIFKKNGFDFIIDEDGLPTQRVKLVSQPTSRNWTFGKDDVDELIFMLSDAPGVLCRPTRVRQMFASRACRKSIMIGTALSKADMKKLVCHMGDLDQPWNCPHGRPTMRHLFNLNMIPD